MTAARVLPLAFVGVLALPGTAFQVQEFKLLADDGLQGDLFGTCVAVDGDTAMVGAPMRDDPPLDGGTVYVFEREVSGINIWTPVGEVGPLDPAGGLRFGSSLSLSGNVAAIGAQHAGLNDEGAVYMFVRDVSGVWFQEAELKPSAGEKFDGALAVSGETLVIGDITSRTAHVFERNHGGPGAWGKVVVLSGSGPVLGSFGASVAIEEDTIAVGSSSLAPGAAYIFERDLGGPNAWGERAVLTTIEAGTGDFFGSPVALSQGTLMVGAMGDDHSDGTDCGSVYIFERDAGGANAWGEVGKLIAGDPNSGDYFGWSISVSGTNCAISAWGASPGAAYTFKKGTTGWSQAHKLTASDPDNGDEFGVDVSASDQTVPVGAPKHGPPLQWTGAAYVYWLLEPTGTSYCTAGVSASGCQAAVNANGSASAVSPSGFFLTAAGVEGAKDGMFFYGANGRQAVPWGTGFQCVVPPVKRGGLMPGIGTANECDGAFSQDLNAVWCPTCPKPLHNPGAGATVQAQFWYRDPWNTATTKGTTMSDAIEFTVGL